MRYICIYIFQWDEIRIVVLLDLFFTSRAFTKCNYFRYHRHGDMSWWYGMGKMHLLPPTSFPSHELYHDLAYTSILPLLLKRPLKCTSYVQTNQRQNLWNLSEGKIRANKKTQWKKYCFFFSSCRRIRTKEVGVNWTCADRKNILVVRQMDACSLLMMCSVFTSCRIVYFTIWTHKNPTQQKKTSHYHLHRYGRCRSLSARASASRWTFKIGDYTPEISTAQQLGSCRSDINLPTWFSVFQRDSLSISQSCHFSHYPRFSRFLLHPPTRNQSPLSTIFPPRPLLLLLLLLFHLLLLLLLFLHHSGSLIPPGENFSDRNLAPSILNFSYFTHTPLFPPSYPSNHPPLSNHNQSLHPRHFLTTIATTWFTVKIHAPALTK